MFFTKENTLINSYSPNSINEFRNSFLKYFYLTYNNQYTLIFLCIGTDRCTGDSLGPIIGENLSILNINNVLVYGTLEHPVHARNLVSTLNQIYKKYFNPYIIAIDAALGKYEHIGFIDIGTGGITPGMAAKKDLPEVGHLYITGIVNISGFLELITLQNTRLYDVIRISNVIFEGIKQSIKDVMLSNLVPHIY